VKGSVRVKGSSRHSDIISGESKGKLGAIGGVEYMLTKKVGVDLRYDRGLFGKGQKSHALQLGFSILLKN
jgi:opacity protein-like surface antigen